MMKLYRSGHLTPLESIPNRASELFDRLAVITGANTLPSYAPRSSSVFMAPEPEAAYKWSGWRKQQELDSHIWEISLPEEGLYTYNISYYDDFAQAYKQFEDGNNPEEHYREMLRAVMRYYRNAVPLNRFTGAAYTEVLVSWDNANQAHWELHEARLAKAA